MSETTAEAGRAKPAFRGEAGWQRAAATAKALLWTAGGAAARALAQPGKGEARFETDTPAPSPAVLRRAYLQAFEKDVRDVAAGLYPPMPGPAPRPDAAVRIALDLLADAREVDARRRRRGGVEVREEAPSDAYPIYYRQNFHYQSGGWFTSESARRYDAQVETLFAGAAAAMRRRALSLLARAWRGRDHRGLTVVDAACGSGAFLGDLRRAFPRARIAGVDLSAAYLAEARRRSGAAAVQANVERLPFGDAALDAVTCIYLFHELPPRVRPVVAAEFARVLKPGGVLAFADSRQASDAPDLKRLLEAFPALFHEPYYASYQAENLTALFSSAGLEPAGEDHAFFTKAMLWRKTS
jgi:ubiquinone/menaquinone biosynthesis C-methylase UbiE